MMSLSWSCCLASISLTVFSAIRNNFPKTLLLLTGICWFVTAVFLFVAIGLEAAEMPKFRDMLKDALNDIKGNGRLLSWKFIIKIPWSIVIVGIGATYALVNSVLSAIFYRRYTPEPVVRQWYPLQNGTSVQTNNSQNVANSGAVFEQENQQRNVAQQLFPVLGQGNQNQNSASPGPMSTQGNHIKNMAGLQLSDNDNQTRKLAYPPPDTVEGNQQQTMAETEFLVWGQGDQPREFAYPAPI